MARGSGETRLDEVLARRTRRGDAGAFAALAARYWHAVHRIAWNMLPNASEAGEVTEETFLRALRSPESFPSDVPFRTSLYRLAIKLSLIRRHPRPRFAAESLDLPFPQFDESGRVVSDGGSDLVEALVRRRDLTGPIREALERVDHLDRASFVLREIEQLSAHEAAAILETSPASVREGTHRAYLALTGFLGLLIGSAPMRRSALP